MQPESTAFPHPFSNRNMHVVFCVSLLAIMGVVSITPAFPAIQQALDLSDAAVGLLITVFTLPGALLAPVMGLLADRYGRKRVLLPSLLLFGIAGCGCALAQNLTQLLVLRLFQGIGAAALGSLNLTIIGDMYSGRECSSAMGLNAAIITMGIVSYPVLGGLLATLSWHAPFLMTGLAFPVAAFAWHSLSSPAPSTRAPLSAYLAGALSGLQRLPVLALLLAMIATSIIMFGVVMHYLTLRLHTHFGASMVQIGLLYTGPALVAGGVASQLGRITRRVSERTLLMAAFLSYALACGVTPFMPGLWFHFLPFSLLGLGQGLSMPCIQSLLAGYAPAGQRAGFMTLSSMSLRLGQTLGPVVMTAVAAFAGPLAMYPAGMALSLCVLAMLAFAFRSAPHA